MPDSTPARPADRNLLLGILALQMDFISRDALIKAMNAWVLEKNRPLEQILREHGALRGDEQALLAALVQKHLERHGNAPAKSLAAVDTAGSVREELERINDLDVNASLVHVAGRPPEQGAYASPNGPHPSQAPAAISRFRILRPHARGGLGEVFVAFDEEVQREVALKEIQDHHADTPGSRARFLLEAQLTGRLEHPGIVPVYGLGTYADGRPYYAMRFIRGDSLQTAIADFHKADGPGRELGERALALRGLLRRFVDVCNVVAYAHSRGILHRDLKPGNVMLGRYGETIVVDWGLAKPLNQAVGEAAGEEATIRPPTVSGSAMTQMGQVLGTPAYMSPEQAAGRLDQLGPASDVYSLGALLYAILTGKVPVAGNDPPEVLRKVQQGDWPPPLQVKRDLPRPLNAVCLKAMARQPSDRYHTPLELARDVEHWMADEPISAYPEPWYLRVQRWLGRHRTLMTGAAAAVLAALTSLAIATLLLSAANTRERDATTRAETKEREAVEQREQAEDNLYLNTVALANREYGYDNLDHVATLLEQCPPRLRGWEWNFLKRQCDAVQLTYRGHNGPVTSAAFSPDGRLVVSGGQDGTVRIWEASTGHELHVLRGHTDYVLGVAWRPDGKQIASVGRDAALRLWDPETGQETHVLRAHTVGIGAVAYSADGGRLATAGWDKVIRIWDANTGKALQELRGHAGCVVALAFSPEGTRLVSVDHYLTGAPNQRMPESVKLWSLSAAAEPRTLSQKNYLGVGAVAFSPEGQSILVGEFGGTVTTYDADTGEELRKDQAAAHATRLALDREGHRMAMAGGIVYHANGGPSVSIVKNPGVIRLAERAGGTVPIDLRGHVESVTALAFSPTSSQLLSASLDGTVKIWGWTTQRRTFQLPASEVQIAFCENGERLLAFGKNHMQAWSTATGSSLWLHRNGAVAHLSQDRRYVATDVGAALKAGDKHTIEVRETRTGALVGTFKLNDPPRTWALSPDGSCLAVLTGVAPPFGDAREKPAALSVWDVATGRRRFECAVTTRGRSDLAFSPDGKTLARSNIVTFPVETPCSIHLHDSQLGTERLTLPIPDGYILQFCYSPDGKLIAAGGRAGTTRIWEAATGKLNHLLGDNTTRVDSVAFSPDGSMLASASMNKAVVWDVQTGRLVQAIWRHNVGTPGLLRVAFSPDGRRLLTSCAGEDPGARGGTPPQDLLLSDVGTGLELLRLGGHKDLITDFAFSPDGTRLVSASQDGLVQLWDASP